ncbi:type 4a pilus biogenesis protein PilO [Vibrio sp. SCSIO 43136]|uniref:type 4a pilus biogenesis protein PilO n=1 Tax=Vibrio sp. SCSIO 43136 TaxID=2819101 RepID=UPI002075ED00|nr:type 4a pilus biogenesis protein PilO [Vibrio sp. SCSIO 43136]USD65498.1 type 4a pilus biogenesis protein PilO [Vibrio sp. SCSIO 43136]
MQSLEMDEFAYWPRVYQWGVIALVCFALLLLGWWFYLVPQHQALSHEEQQEQSLKSLFEIKARQVAALPKYDQQLKLLNQRYQLLQQQLPEQKELATLLASINELGIKHDLTFTRIDWGERQVTSELYRYPLNIELTGSYENIGDFSQAIGELPRIVNFADVDWQRVSQESKTLHFRVRAFAYQFRPGSTDAEK